MTTPDSTPAAVSDQLTSSTTFAPRLQKVPSYRWLVTGANGQLGTEVVGLLAELGAADVVAASRDVVDITDAHGCSTAIERWLAEGDEAPGVVINCAAYTAVDAAETDEESALRVNGDGPRNLATAIGARARLIQVSTDYVFAGDASSPYATDAHTAPRTAYGRTKDVGDAAVRDHAPDTGYVVRTAWVYGAHGPNFVKTMTKLAKTHDTLSVVNDQVGSPTWTRHLAAGLLELAVSDAPAGYYHCTGGGQCSWFDFTRAIFVENGLDPQRVEPTTSEAFVRPAPRPAYSVLSGDEWSAAGLTPLPSWQAGLHEAFERDGAALRGDS